MISTLHKGFFMEKKEEDPNSLDFEEKKKKSKSSEF
jgi:hypothetical protein